MTAADCCVGEPCYGDPKGMHSDDCPAYLASMEALEAQRREQKSPERRTVESSILTASLRRAITHLKDVAAGHAQPDAHTDRLVELGAELGAALDEIRNNQTKEAS